MSFGTRLSLWRRHRRLRQAELAQKADISRVYLSRLEQGKADPALSVLRRLSVALDISVGELVEKQPPVRVLSRHELDALARGALRPSAPEARGNREVRALAGFLRERRKALGTYHPRKKAASFPDHRAARRLRAEIGEEQWQALLRRIEKHGETLAGDADETQRH